ncbi:MAG TPA: biopolymer transporter ExbD [Candidatus Cloacimonadota bacterium]|jgi:biopolymer transport protein ExbD|nr:biopolymer transporter ExbD [Candidatus Cloacimonadales bacterium]HOE91224.1 biopolymer transporter ExbD [Candidatus Cloacimonadota bacterium]HOQ80326.1 biopolymer transporter ExbD [Candidatus Cloacimonadota bacterium]HPY96436.1 biopolymer transporter ExbD [Candidatus Cloacimonadota bacterium]HQB41432.1 biopolymer transporter ExbD [Candidatus Cloacimonadota bacterium]
MAKIKKAERPKGEIPTASMSDIAFLLLIFFIVSTVFVKGKMIKVAMPKAESIDKIPRSHAATLYVDRMGNITIDDYSIQIPQVEYIMIKKLQEDFNLITCFRTDREVSYGVMADIMNQLRKANALRVSFEAKRKL